jgi:hypothetical protein
MRNRKRNWEWACPLCPERGRPNSHHVALHIGKTHMKKLHGINAYPALEKVVDGVVVLRDESDLVEVVTMGSRAADMDKMHRKALKRSTKKKLEARSCYRLAPESKEILLLDSMNAKAKIKTKIVGCQFKSGLRVVKSVICPHCKVPIEWDDVWQGFVCRHPSHPRRKGVYEMVNPTKVF